MNTTGMFTAQTYGEVFRLISNKRRSGTLDLTIEGEVTRVSFYNGKIVDAVSGDKTGARALLKWLVDGEILDADITCDEEMLPNELYQSLVSTSPGFMPEADFKEMVRERVFDVLFSCNLKAGGFYEFHTEVPAFDRDFSPSISVGQLLLDLVSFEADEVRYLELFPEGFGVRRTAVEAGALLGGESIVYGLLDVPCLVDGLKLAALMSKFGFREAMLSLAADGLIEAVDPNRLDKPPEGISDGKDLIEAVDGDGFEEIQASSAAEPAAAAEAARDLTYDLGFDQPTETPAAAAEEVIATHPNTDQVADRFLDESFIEGDVPPEIAALFAELEAKSQIDAGSPPVVQVAAPIEHKVTPPKVEVSDSARFELEISSEPELMEVDSSLNTEQEVSYERIVTPALKKPVVEDIVEIETFASPVALSSLGLGYALPKVKPAAELAEQDEDLVEPEGDSEDWEWRDEDPADLDGKSRKQKSKSSLSTFSSRRSFMRSVRMLNSRLAKSALVQQVLAVAFLVAVLILPLTFWRGVFKGF